MIMPALLAALALGVVLSAPRRLRSPRWTLGVLWIGACLCAAHLSRSPLGAALGGAAALAPFAARVFERGTAFLPLALLLNGHAAALFGARLLASVEPGVAAQARPWVVAAALLAAAAAAASAFFEPRPRRTLLRLIVGQGALVLAGLACGGAQAGAGALALLQSASVSSMMLACACAGLDARARGVIERPGFLGLASGAPRLAVFSGAAAFAFAGLPLTMGFPAAELLLGGLVEAGPAGLALPVIAALNAFVVLRLFARLFWGSPLEAAAGMPDALPRERWALSAGLLFLVFGGLFPSALIP